MINVDFANIDNAKLIGRLLPFWARGRKFALLLQALISPIISTHNKFKSWALQKYIECHITAQKPSIEWYLKYMLKSHFYSENDVFFITQGTMDVIIGLSDHLSIKGIPIKNPFLGFDDKLIAQDINLLTECIYVYAPAIVETIDYNKEDYERDIRYIMSKYMINFNKITVRIAEINT